MIMTNFLQERRSVRDFMEESLASNETDKIKGYIEELNGQQDVVTFKFYENGSIVYDGLNGKAGYSGVMIKAPHYIAMKYNKRDLKSGLLGGFYLESLNTKIVENGFGTCWVTVKQVESTVRKAIFGEIGEDVDYVIAIGRGKGKKIFLPEKTSGRKPVDEIVFKDKLGNPISHEELENRGLLDVFSSVRFAPSFLNAQPWAFVLRDTVVDLYTLKKEETRRITDMGVIMFYFQEMIKRYVPGGAWEVVEPEEVGEYEKIAEYKI